MTTGLVSKLNQIHEENFGKACEKIKEYQDAYKRNYDERNKVKAFDLKIGDRVQLKRMRTSKAKGGKNELKWLPRNSVYTLRKINKRHKTVLLYNPATKKDLGSSYSFDRIRAFKKR